MLVYNLRTIMRKHDLPSELFNELLSMCMSKLPEWVYASQDEEFMATWAIYLYIAHNPKCKHVRLVPFNVPDVYINNEWNRSIRESHKIFTIPTIILLVAIIAAWAYYAYRLSGV